MERVDEKLSSKIANMGIVSAFLVVAMHGYSMSSMPAMGTLSWWFYKLFKENFTNIAVPYFFLVSAFFLAGHQSEDGWFIREVFKRVRTIVIPFFLWALIAVLVKSFGFALLNVLRGAPAFN